VTQAQPQEVCHDHSNRPTNRKPPGRKGNLVNLCSRIPITPLKGTGLYQMHQCLMFQSHQCSIGVPIAPPLRGLGHRGEKPPPPDREHKADLPLFAALFQGTVSLYRDMSGDSLHRRGWRSAMHKASLNESAAAGLLLMSGWPKQDAGGIYCPLITTPWPTFYPLDVTA
jgi:hypothetical protein